MAHIFDLPPSITTILREYMLGPESNWVRNDHLCASYVSKKRYQENKLFISYNITIILNEMHIELIHNIYWFSFLENTIVHNVKNMF